VNKTFTEEQKDEAVRRFEAGETKQSIGDDIGCSGWSVGQWAKGFNRNGKGDGRKKNARDRVTGAQRQAKSSPPVEEKPSTDLLQLPVSINGGYIKGKTDELIAELTHQRDVLNEAIELLGQASAKM